MTTDRLRIVVWCAVSSDTQAEDDKASLPDQERAGREWAQANGGLLLDVLRWDGYSRWESDPISALEEYAREGRMEYHRLREMWQARALDVLWCANHSRLGRSFTMQSWVIENVIRSGARIYRAAGGWITDTDYPMQVAMGGFATTTEMERLRHGIRIGLDKRLQLGRPLGSSAIWSHRQVRDDKGRVYTLSVDEDKRDVLERAADLILEGLPWAKLEMELYSRYGYGRGGKPYAFQMFYTLFYHPVFHGHVARNFNASAAERTIARRWVVDPYAPVPEGIQVVRDAMPPVFTGQRGEAIRQELLRRIDNGKGRAAHINPDTQKRRSSMFSGLLVCVCGYRRAYRKRKPTHRATYACESVQRRKYSGFICNEKPVFEHVVQAYLDTRLREMVAAPENDVFFTADTSTDWRAEVNRLRQQNERYEIQIRRLIQKQADMSADLARLYDDEIRAISDKLRASQASFQQAQQSLYHQKSGEHERTIETIRAMTVDAFWQLPTWRINTLLHALLGGNLLQIKDRQVYRIVRKVR